MAANQASPTRTGGWKLVAITTALVFLVDIIWFPERGHNVHNY